MTHEPEGPVLHLVPWTGPFDSGDPDANFKADVAVYSLADPLSTLGNVAGNLGIPVGALARYVLAKWASGGSEGLLELGPSTVERMRAAVDAAEQDGTDAARLEAYATLRAMVGWLVHGIDDPEATYPDGGGEPAGDRSG